MRSKHIFLLVFCVGVLIRLILNFSIELIPGGGGYYPVQINAILENGILAIRDMPCIFYVNAMIVKILSFLLPNVGLKDLIIIVYKIIDSISLPIILFPLYMIQRDLFRNNYSKIFLFAVAGYAVLSYSPLELTSDAQKNSVALVFLMFFIYYYLMYMDKRTRKHLIYSLLMLVMIYISHFGTFTISVCFLLISLIIRYRWKAVFPVIVISATGTLLVAVFDSERALSLVTFWMRVFTIFVSRRLVYYPQGIFNYISTIILLWYIIKLFKTKGAELPENTREMIWFFMIYILVLAFPFYKFEFGRRLGLMLFVPQSIILLLLYPYLKEKVRVILSAFVLLLVVFTTSFRLIDPKPFTVTDEAYADLKKIGEKIKDPESTIIYVRHTLEWWVAWENGVHIAMPGVEVDDEMIEKYDQILFLVQKKGANSLYPGKISPFINPTLPENNELFYDSEYFELYELQNKLPMPKLR